MQCKQFTWIRKQIIVAIVMIAGTTLAAEQSNTDNSITMDQSKSIFTQFQSGDHAKTQTVDLNGIPFAVIPTDRGYKNLVPCTFGMYVKINKTFDRIFFLGMTTDKPEGSEWWGANERWYAQQDRVFIGDQLGRIQIVYKDQTNEIIPLIFGVNVWFYELFTPLKDGEEKYLKNYGMTSPEPFASDPKAKAILDESLHLMANDTVKGGRYIFAIIPQTKEIESIAISNMGFRLAGVQVTAVTGLNAGQMTNRLDSWKCYDESYFSQKKYYSSMDRLARRLYQFRDELPASLKTELPRNYKGPRVEFKGNGLADIFTNVYSYNVWDMACNKIDPNGGMHTSTRGAPNFGLYVGFGTFEENAGHYSNQIWSRDIGRCLTELTQWGETERTRKAAESLLTVYLYDKSLRFKQPNWKRIANAAQIAEATGNQKLLKLCSGKENDGHGAIMLFIYSVIEHGVVDKEWVNAHWKNISDATEWYCWQMEHPDESGFNKVLSSESEASTQQYGCCDLFSNAQAWHGLVAFSRLARQMGQDKDARRWEAFAAQLKKGMMERFTGEHPRYGRIFTDTTYDVWTWEYKAQAFLFLYPDLFGYDPAQSDPELFAISRNTYLAQKEDYFSYAAGRQMGYGQGYITESAILMDDPADMRGYVEQAAAFCYHHSYHNYIVPEGVIMHPSGRFWFRNCDLGNCVQQAEIVKCARLLIGLDDLNPDTGLSLIPRLPQGWTEIKVQDYPVITQVQGSKEQVLVSYICKRTAAGFDFKMNSDRPIKLNTLRLGPLPEGKSIKTKGKGKIPSSKIVNRYGQTFVYFDLSRQPSQHLDVSVLVD